MALGRSVPVTVFARAGTRQAINYVELFLDGVSAGAKANGPFVWDLSNLTMGSHQAMARLNLSDGTVLDSSVVSIQTALEPYAATLIPSRSVWKFLDNGSNQGTAWTQTDFNDSSWSSGPARFGYGGDGEETTVSYGGNASAKHIATYFRQSFVAPGAVITNLTFRLVRDDGAVVFLNGRELYRSNMPGGALNYTTLASSAVGGADEQTFYPTSLSITNLLPGTNVVAVEVHQASANSSDLGFDLELVGNGYIPAPVSALSLRATVSGDNLTLRWPVGHVGYRVFATDNLGPRRSGLKWS